MKALRFVLVLFLSHCRAMVTASVKSTLRQLVHLARVLSFPVAEYISQTLKIFNWLSFSQGVLILELTHLP